MSSAFWDGHQRDMENPEYAREFEAASICTRETANPTPCDCGIECACTPTRKDAS